MKKILALALVAMVIFAGCNRTENEEGIGKLSVRLTDAPGDYKEVLIDIKQLLVHVSGEDNSEWLELPLEINEPINLLDLANDNDTLLAELDFPAGKISQMRMVLGDENYITVEEKTVVEEDTTYATYGTYELDTPSAMQSGLKFNVHAEIQEGVTYRMWIDFDAARSVIKRGNGNYVLKPTIKAFTKENSGDIKGVVAPVDTTNLANVHAIAGVDTLASTIIETSGEFLLKGLEEGSYTVSVAASDDYLEKNISDVGVEIGLVTDLDTIFVN